MKRISIFLIFLSIVLCSCYLFTTDVTVNIINNTDQDIVSIRFINSNNDLQSNNILVYNLSVGASIEHVFVEGTYILEVELDDSTIVFTEELYLIDVDVYELFISKELKNE